MQVERRLGGYLLDKPKQMLFHFTASNLCVSIEDFSPGWRCKQNANYQVRLDGFYTSYLKIILNFETVFDD